MSLVHDLYAPPAEAFYTIRAELEKVGGHIPSDALTGYPTPRFNADPEVAVVPFLTLQTPLQTLVFILSVLQKQAGNDLEIWSALELSNERCAFDVAGVFHPCKFSWMRVKFDAHQNIAPLAPSSPEVHPLAGLVALTALACHPERLRHMLKEPKAGIWLPGIRNAPKSSILEWDVRSRVRKGNVLRVGRGRVFPVHGIVPPPLKILFASAPGDMLDSDFSIPNIIP